MRRTLVAHVSSRGVLTRHGRSRANVAEAKLVLDLAENLAPTLLEQRYALLIITPYAAHVGVIAGWPIRVSELP